MGEDETKYKYSKRAIEAYVKSHTLADSICGFDHCKRVYLMAKRLGRDYDDNVLHAAAFLHDIGIHRKNHEKASAERAEKVIGDSLQKHKLHEVKEAIINHVSEGKPKSPEAILIHDADMLDYLGMTGFIRLVFIARDWYGKSDIYEVLRFVKNYKERVADKLILKQSKSKAADLLNIMDLILQQAEEELE